MDHAVRRPEPLFWGNGPRVFEIFVEPTCPYSVRAFNKLDVLLATVGEECLTIKVRLQSQPWHLFSGVIVRCILAASLLADGKASAKRLIEIVGRHREEFEFELHCRGPNMDVTPNALIARLEQYSGLGLREAFEAPEVNAEFKWHVKYARQNGIHFSPTFMIDGLIQPDMASGDDVADWARKLAS
jgi:hypothetical protein